MEAQYGKFLDMIRVVQINIPLVDVLARMPNYGKFLKELVSYKHQIEQISAAFLCDESSAILQNKVPPKLGDPGSFLIPCNFIKAFSCNALANLGSSINLMSIDVIDKILEEDFDALLDKGKEPPTDLELKPLLDNLEYVFLEEPFFLLMIISSQLSEENKNKPISVLKRHKQAFAWKMLALLFCKVGVLQVNWTSYRPTAIRKDYYCNNGIDSLDWAKNKNPKTLKKTVAFADEGPSVSNTDKIMAQMDIMTMKIDAQYKKLQCRPKQPILDLNDDDTPMSREEEAKFMQTFHEILEDFDAFLDERSKILHSIKGTILEEELFAEFDEFVAMTANDNSESESDEEELQFKKITVKKGFQPERMAQRCKDAQLVLNWEKCHFMVKEGIVLGHKVSRAGLEVDKVKIDVILKLPPPTNVKDHSALRNLFKNQDAKPRLISWILLLQEFDIEIKDKKGTENVAADYLSRIENDETSDDSELDDNFPEETLMKINTIDEPWFEDSANYLEEPYLFKVCSNAAVDYLSKWAKAKALPTNDGRVVITFLKKLFYRFGIPKALISDRGTHFCNKIMEKTMKRYGVNHCFSTSYHPQMSGQVKSTNRALKRILKKTVKDKPAIWSRKLDDALWAFRTAYKTPTGTTPYKLIYGKNCHLPFEIKHRSYWALKNCNPYLIATSEKRMFQLHELDELRNQAYENSHLYKTRTKVWHDRKLK
ncbi:reverse transcriptase domain-containing protein [Tanacetum coccineum]